MSTHPYIPLYVDDYDAHTAHLTPAEDGVYLRLLRLCWRTPGCSLPNDDAWIARKIRADRDMVASMLAEFFVRQGRSWVSPALNRWAQRQAAPDRRDRRGVPLSLRRMILERDGQVCRYCGSRDGPWHIDHVVAVSRGGTDDPQNLCVSCEPCNLSKGAKLLAEWCGR